MTPNVVRQHRPSDPGIANGQKDKINQSLTLMKKQRYHVIKAHLTPRIYAKHAYGRKFGFVVTEWTDDAAKARTFGYNEAIAVANRNAHAAAVVKP